MEGGGGGEGCDHSNKSSIKKLKKEGLRLFHSEYKTRDYMQLDKTKE